MKKILMVAMLLGHLVTTAQAQVNAQWRGPERNGIFQEEGLLDSWPDDGPELLFYVEDIGKGYSSAVYDAGVCYVTGMKDTLDYLTAIDVNGQVLWQVAYGTAWAESFPDTRCTPTVEGDRIYVISGTGELVCLNLSGKTLWKVEVDHMFDAKWHVWGVSESPLIVGDLVLCTPVGEKASMAAFNKENGSLVWTSEPVNGRRSYVSPILYEYEEHRLILAMSSTDLFAVKPEDGSLAWTFRYLDLVPEEDEEDEEAYEEEYEEEEDEEDEEEEEEEEDEEEEEEEDEDEEDEEEDDGREEGWIYTNTPVYHKSGIFLTAGYDMPAAMLKLNPEGDGVQVKFTDRTLDSHHHGVVLVDGYLYGSNWYNNSRGRWVCMKWSTGEIKYVDEWKTKGSIQYADGKLYVYEDRGTVGLVEPDKDGFEVISSFRITRGRGPHWAHLGIYDGKLLVRHGEVLMVYNIQK